MSFERARSAAPWVLLVLLSFAFRFPALLNASATNSDAAIVGIQAMHILRGQWSPFLLGSGYQTSADSLVAALFFAVMGPKPLALMFSALCLHVTSTLLAFAALRRHVGEWLAVTLALTLVFTTSCLHSYALYPPRQLSLTLAMSAVFVLDSARSARRLAVGGALTTLAWLCDPYAVVLVPGLAVLALLRIRASSTRAAAAMAYVGGALPGAGLLWLLWKHPSAQHGVAGLSTDVVAHNVDLLGSDCFPWMSGTAIYAPVHWMDYVRVPEESLLHAFQIAGVAIAIAGVLYGMVLAPRSSLDALATTAAVTIGATLGGFLVARMVMDSFSMRYLAAIVVVLPFALAPLARRLGLRRLAPVIAPYLVTAAIGGWLGFGPYVRGVVPVLTPSGRALDEARLIEALQARGVHEAVADYWSAYRLTFLSKEAVVFVPLHEEQDRYAPYRARFAAASTFAYVNDELRSFEDRDQTEEALLAANGGVAERLDIGVFHALIVKRSPR